MWFTQLCSVHEETNKCASNTFAYQKPSRSYMFRLVWSHAEAVQDSIERKRATAYLILLKMISKFVTSIISVSYNYNKNSYRKHQPILMACHTYSDIIAASHVYWNTIKLFGSWFTIKYKRGRSRTRFLINKWWGWRIIILKSYVEDTTGTEAIQLTRQRM